MEVVSPRLRYRARMIESLVEQIEARYAEVQAQMSDPEVISDRAALRRRRPPVQPARPRRQAGGGVAPRGVRRRGRAGADRRGRRRPGDARGARVSRASGSSELEEEIRLAMVETDPNDDKNVIVEIRGGAGGDEAGLWAGDLYRMLTRYAERLGFKTETLDASDGSYTFEVRGDGAYSRFKYEGGTHRVQRVPATESQGRIHTSTATVAVLPEAEDVEVDDRPERPRDRRLPLVRPRRPVRQHDRLRRAHHAQADRPRRLDAGREVAAAEPRARDEGPARAAVRA